MAKVYTPLKDYNGISASITFLDGAGETDNENLLEWFEERGYTVEREEKPKRGKKTKGATEETSEETSEGATEETSEGVAEEVAEGNE